MCNGTAPHNHNHPQKPTYNPYFAQKFAQLDAMRNTMCNTDGNAYHIYTQNPIPENLCKRLRKRSRDINTDLKSVDKTTFAFFDIIDE